MSIYKLTGDNFVMQERLDDEMIFIAGPEVTELSCDIDFPYWQISLFQMTDAVERFDMDFYVQGIDKFRIVSKDTGEVIVESSAFVNDQVDDIICEELDEFCYEYNENPAEAIEKLKRGDYDPMEIL